MEKIRRRGCVRLLLSCFWLCVSFLTVLSSFGHTEEIYRYKRMWPILPQPWYFFYPHSVVVDKVGNVYVADTYNHRIQKFTSSGQFIARWGSQGSGDGQFNQPKGIAVDSTGNVYVADTYNFRIQKFTSDGQFIIKWGSPLGEEGAFWLHQGIAVDSTGNVYVADTGNCRIQKFSSDGQFIAQWGSSGSGDGHFEEPAAIAIDSAANVYVADTGNCRIQKFTAEGHFLATWGSEGGADGQFLRPAGIAIDSAGNVHVADTDNCRLQKFTAEGQFLARWGSEGGADGQFLGPAGIAIDSTGNVYVADTFINRIQKLTSGGQFLAKWGSSGSGDGQFLGPAGIAIDSAGNVYVADVLNQRIQKFTADGQFLAKWGSYGAADGAFWSPDDIAIDNAGNVYVADEQNNLILKFTYRGQFLGKWGTSGSGDGQIERPLSIATDSDRNVYLADASCRIQKFTSDGQFLAKWESYGPGDGEYCLPGGLAVDSSGNVYVTDASNNRINKFTSDGQFIYKWGIEGSADGQLNAPGGIALDTSGHVYVVDAMNDRIQKFTSDGQFVAKWGSTGSGPDGLKWPVDLAVAQSGDVYVTDTNNQRIQVFKQVSQESRSKAIIVAGGGPNAGTMSDLWDATQMCTNFAYRALNYQGFIGRNIRYLSANTGLDLDSNGISDIFGKATNQNLKQSITEWAKDADNLILYLSDHGGNETFIMSDALEILRAKDLALWLDAIPDTRVTLVYDACKSGSFLAPLASSVVTRRILITSTNPKEDAFYGNLGSLSFSNFFWTQIFNGSSLAQAFSVADNATRLSLGIHPLVEANGNGNPNDPDDIKLLQGASVTSQTSTFNSPPNIKKISAKQTPDKPSTASFVAEGVTDKERDSISRVWAVIRPPNYSSAGSGNPLNDLPYVNLARVKNTNRYEGSYGGFNTPGIYHVAFYAMDEKLNVSTPKTTKVIINSPLTHKAILVAGWSPNKDLRSAVGYNMKLAYKTLQAQHYAKKDIRVLSSVPNLSDVPVNSTATLQHLREAIEVWAKDNTQDLVVYLVGDGQKGSFMMNQKEKLSGSNLSAWLDSFQAGQAEAGDAVVIFDACRSGSFLPLLLPHEGKRRVAIASATEEQPAWFEVGGVVSFSQFFWTQALNGANVRDAFMEAQSAINRASRKLQLPQLDDNGNGIGNEPSDLQVARLLKIGMGIASAGNGPVICGKCVGLTGNIGTSATIWAKNITTTGRIDMVRAMIIPPNYRPGSADNPVTKLSTLDLKHMGSGKYQATYRGFSEPGEYDVAVYAIDTEGNVSLPQQITVSR